MTYLKNRWIAGSRQYLAGWHCFHNWTRGLSEGIGANLGFLQRWLSSFRHLLCPRSRGPGDSEVVPSPQVRLDLRPLVSYH